MVYFLQDIYLYIIRLIIIIHYLGNNNTNNKLLGDDSMILNIILGFIIPWVFGVILYYKDKKVILIIVPFMAVWAYFLNEILFHLNFFRLAPLNIDDDYTTMAINVGLYPLLVSYLIYFIKSNKTSRFILVIIFALMPTIAEYLGLLFHIIIYKNGWNLGWSFLSYILYNLIGYWYYNKVEKYWLS